MNLSKNLALAAPVRLIVYCHGRISRSPAIAYGLLAGSGLAPPEALQVVLDSRPSAAPNALIVRRLDAALPGVGLQAAYVKWGRRQDGGAA